MIPTISGGQSIRQISSGIQSRLVQAGQAVFLIVFMNVLAAGSAHAQAIVMGPFFDTLVGENPCTGEPVIGSAKTFILMYVRPDPNNGPHFTFRFITHSQAQTLAINPKKYQQNNEEGTEANAPASGSVEITTVLNNVLVRQGEDTTSNLPLTNDDDFVYKQTIHITMDANGAVTANVDQSHGMVCAATPLF